MPKIDIGRLRSLSPLHISVKVLACYSTNFALFAGAHTCDSSSNDVDTDRARAAPEESGHNQSRKVRCRCGRNKPDLSKQDKSVKLRPYADPCSSHLRETRYKRQSILAYDPCSLSKVRRATERPQHLRSTMLSPNTAMGSYLVRFRILPPSGHCQSRRHQQVSQSR